MYFAYFEGRRIVKETPRPARTEFCEKSDSQRKRAGGRRLWKSPRTSSGSS